MFKRHIIIPQCTATNFFPTAIQNMAKYICPPDTLELNPCLSLKKQFLDETRNTSKILIKNLATGKVKFSCLS